MPAWIIQSIDEPELFWCNSTEFVGWGTGADVAAFTRGECRNVNLPIGGTWLPLPETSDMVLIGEGKERAEVNAVWDSGFQVELMDREEGGNLAFGFEEVVWSQHDEVWMATEASRFVPATAEALLMKLSEHGE